MAVHPIRGLSICAGIGGIDLGLKRAMGRDYVTRCYIEREACAAAILAARIEDKQLCEAPIWSDVFTFDAGPWAGRIDLIAAGIPCQPWSVAGKRRGHADKRHLWAPTYRIIRRLRPRLFFLENVPTIVNGGGVEPIWRDLRDLGYRVEGGFFAAASLGAPHIRKRFFLLAYADGHSVRNAAQQIGDTAGKDAIQFDEHGHSQQMANADSVRQLQCVKIQREKQQRPDHGSETKSADVAWKPESFLGRIVDGLCPGVDRPGWGPDWEGDMLRVAPIAHGYTVRLRALGNAVVPAVAAHAFATLVRRHHAFFAISQAG